MISLTSLAFFVLFFLIIPLTCRENKVSFSSAIPVPKGFIEIYFRAFRILLFTCLLEDEKEFFFSPFHPNLLLNGYVCAFSAVRKIAQWRDRYRLPYAEQHRAHSSRRENASERSSSQRRENRERNRWKIENAFSHNLASLVLSNGFSLKPYFQFGFWVSWFKLISTPPVQTYYSPRAKGKTEKEKEKQERQSKCEFCVPLSVGLLYDIN